MNIVQTAQGAVRVLRPEGRLDALRPSVQESFEIAGFTSVLVFRSTVEEAISACAG